MPSSSEAPAIPIKEFDHEMDTTRRMLSRLPSHQEDFKPHETSMEFGYLSALVAAIPGWIAQTLREDAIDLGAEQRPAVVTTEELLRTFDSNAEQARQALRAETGDRLQQEWSLRHGDTVLMTLPRGEAARQHLSHLVHHRAQLGVYERMLGVKIPQIYGPSADASWERPS